MKASIKIILGKIYNSLWIIIPFLIAQCIVLSFYILTKIRLVSFRNAAITLSAIPGSTGDLCRKFFYKLTLKHVGKNFHIGFGSYIVYHTVTIGDMVTIEEHCVISRCQIGNNVIISSRVSTMSGKNHHYVDDLTKTFYESGGQVKSIILEDNLWIGTHAVVLEDVATGTVIGAGAVVTKKFPPNSIIGGVPAKLIRMRGDKKINDVEINFGIE